MEKQNLLGDEEGQNLVLQFIPDIDILFFFSSLFFFLTIFTNSIISLIFFLQTRNAIASVWRNDGDTTSPLHKWSQFKETIRNEIQKDVEKCRKNRSHKKIFFSDPVVDVVFAFTYPRFDKNVSIGLNHLLKSPFCIHPGTGKLCVPIDPNKSNSFDPDKVPYLESMIEEIAQGQASSMQPYVDYFRKKFLAPIQREMKKSAANDATFDPTSF